MYTGLRRHTVRWRVFAPFTHDIPYAELRERAIFCTVFFSFPSALAFLFYLASCFYNRSSIYTVPIYSGSMGVGNGQHMEKGRVCDLQVLGELT
jgi:hypothetical protein